MDLIFDPTYKSVNTRWICLHHSGGTAANNYASSINETWQEVDEAHRARWEFKDSITGLYGGYNFFCDKNGNVKQFRAIGSETAAQKGYNFDGKVISFCMAGNFLVDQPTEAQKKAFRDFYNKLPEYGVVVPPVNIVPHKYFQTTECNGLPPEWGRQVIQSPQPGDSEKVGLLRTIAQLYLQVIDLKRQLMNYKVKAPLAGIYLGCRELWTRH